MQNQKVSTLFVVKVVVLLFFTVGGSSRDSLSLHLLQERMEHLLKAESWDQAFILSERLIEAERERNDMVSSLLFLNRLYRESGDSPYKGEYLYRIGEVYRKNQMVSTAFHYFKRVVKSEQDFYYRSQFLYKKAADRIFNMSISKREQIEVLDILLNKYSDKEERARSLYYKGKLSEEIGDWESAWSSYELLQREGDSLWGEEVEEKLAFHYSSKGWLMEDLDTLISSITYGFRINDRWRLSRYQSRNFFVAAWNDDLRKQRVRQNFNILSLMGTDLRFASELDPSSDENRVYLKAWATRGWIVTTWYLCFNRVDYPQDYSIHRAWEWSGVYIGEKF